MKARNDEAINFIKSQVMSFSDVMEALSIGQTTLYKMVREGRLKSYKPYGKSKTTQYFKRDEVLEFVFS